MLQPRNYGLVVDGYVVQSTVRVEAEEGPPPPAPTGDDWRLLPEQPDWSAPAGSRLRWRGYDVAPEWEPPALERLRDERNAAINAWKLEANSSYFEFQGERIAFKPSDQIEIQAVHNWITLTGRMPDWPDWPGAWKAISNRWVLLPDVDTWTAFTLAIAERGTAHFKRAQLLKAELAAASTPAEIDAITW